MLRLKAVGYRNVRQVDKGMFGWRQAGMPTHVDPTLTDMPMAIDADEEALLSQLGYNKDGSPRDIPAPDCRS